MIPFCIQILLIKVNNYLSNIWTLKVACRRIKNVSAYYTNSIIYPTIASVFYTVAILYICVLDKPAFSELGLSICNGATQPWAASLVVQFTWLSWMLRNCHYSFVLTQGILPSTEIAQYPLAICYSFIYNIYIRVAHTVMIHYMKYLHGQQYCREYCISEQRTSLQ